MGKRLDSHSIVSPFPLPGPVVVEGRSGMVRRLVQMTAFVALPLAAAAGGEEAAPAGGQADPAFTHVGVAARVATSRGAAATADAQGRPYVMVWITGAPALLLIDAVTGKTEMVRTPSGKGEAPFAILLSSRN